MYKRLLCSRTVMITLLWAACTPSRPIVVSRSAMPRLPEDAAPPGACSDTRDGFGNTQGTDLYGLTRGWDDAQLFDSVLRRSARRDGQPVVLEERGGVIRAVTPVGAQQSLTGVTLLGQRDQGSFVHLALCQRPDEPPTPGRYWLRYYDESLRRWRDACKPDEGHRLPKAMLLTGTWDSAGNYQSSVEELSIVCDTGVIGKCVDWGYDPARQFQGESLRDYHQACTRMARADYCGDGISHTRDGSVIDIEDRLHIKRWGDSGDRPFSLEATWAPDGAVCLRRARNRANTERALQEIVAECPSRFAAVTDHDAEGCRYRSIQGKGLRGAGALLRNRSAVNP